MLRRVDAQGRADSARNLAYIRLPLWFLISVLSTVVLLFYRIDCRAHEANLAKLAGRSTSL